MPNIVVLRLRPDAPVLPELAILPTWDFLDYLNRHPTLSGTVNLKIELTDLSTNSLIGSTQYSTGIVQHLIGTQKQSVATAVINLTGGTIIAGAIDVLIEVKKGSITLLKFVAYKLPVFNVGALPSLPQYQGLAASTIVTLPGQGITYNTANKIALPGNNLAPAYADLNNAVMAAAPGLGITLWDLDMAESQNLASAILLPAQMCPLPPLPPYTLEQMYTEPGAAIYISDRNTYHNSLQLFNAGQAATIVSRAANYIFALSAAHFGEMQSQNATKAQWEFPTLPPSAGNTALCKTMKVVLKMDVGATLPLLPAFGTPAEYFYALGATLPNSVSKSDRYAQAIQTPPADLVDQFVQAISDHVIVAPTGVNVYQAARRLTALNAGNNQAECIIPANTGGTPIDELYDLVNAWLVDPDSDEDIIWTSLVASYPLSHLALVTCFFRKEYPTMISPAAAPLNAVSVRDITDGLIHREEAKWLGLLPGANDLTKLLFIGFIKNYFSVEPAVATVVSADPNIPPGYSACLSDPIQLFIKCYKSVDPSFDFTIQPVIFSATNLESALVCVFPNDTAAQAWLEQQVKDIKDWKSLLEVCNAKDPINAFITCYGAQGFSFSNLNGQKVETAAACVFPDDPCAQEWLSNMINAIAALQLLATGATSGLALQISVMEGLYSKGFTSQEEVLALSFAQFQEALVGTVAYTYATGIYTKAGGDPTTVQTHTNGPFVPVNNGHLSNCIPPEHLSALSPVAYLSDLLLVSPAATCSEPLKEGSTTIGNEIITRRGDINSLKVTAANLDTVLPMIDLVNENLEAMVASTGFGGRAVFNTAETSFDGHALLYRGCEVPDSSEQYQHEPAQLFEAIPEHSTPASTATNTKAYELLKNDFSDPCCLPYHQPFDVSRTYLEQLGVSRYEVLRTFRRDITEFIFDPNNTTIDFQKYRWNCPPSREIAREYLCLSKEECDHYFSGNYLVQPQIRNLCDFMKFLCLPYCDFYELWKSGFVPFIKETTTVLNNHNITVREDFSACESCCCEDIKVVSNAVGHVGDPLSKENLSKISAFVYLWRKLQCVPQAHFSMTELSDICNAFGGFGSGGADLIPNLTAFVMLKNGFGLSLTSDTILPSGTGAKRTQLLALWDNSASLDAERNWAIDHLLDRIQAHAQEHYGCACRPADFIKILKENLDPLSQLMGFAPNSTNRKWKAKPTYTLCFAEKLAAIYASTSSIGEIFFWFTGKEHFAGDDPYLLQSSNEAVEDPFNQAEDDEAFSLWALRKKLLAISVSDAEIQSWSWMKMDATLRNEFGYQPAVGSDRLQSLGNHFFPGRLQTEGYSITAQQKQYRSFLASTPPLMWNSDLQNPFRYDDPANELWAQLPISDPAVIAKLSHLRQLTPDEQKAVQDLYYQPRVDLAEFGFLFSNFTEAQERLIGEPDESKRWAYFQQAFALAFKRCEAIVEHFTQQVESISGQTCKSGNALAWHLLRHLFADENKATSNWENNSGVVPNVTWDPAPNGGAFAALLGVVGTGLQGNFTTKKGLVWREVRGGMEAFGLEENGADSPFPTKVPDIDLNSPSTSFAIVRNGFALANPNAELLGGAEGYTAVWEGMLLVEEPGSYTFRAGAPTPGNDFPDFSKAKQAKWSVSISRGQKIWDLLKHNMAGESAPGECSAPVNLKRGVYGISITYIQSAPTFATKEESCPQTTGFQIKYAGADTDGLLTTIPIDKLFLKKKDDTLGKGVANLAGAAKTFLETQFFSSIRDIRRTSIRAISSMLFAQRFDLSALPTADDGQSEIGYLLANGDKFKGTSFYLQTAVWKTHHAYFNFNFLPVRDSFFPPTSTEDRRSEPTLQRQGAFFDWWCRMFQHFTLRAETTAAPDSPTWLLYHEALEGHPDNAGQLLWHLGIDITHASAVTKFLYFSTPPPIWSTYSLITGDLTDERWAFRVWQAEKFLRKIRCGLAAKDLSAVNPALWTSDVPEKEGNANLMKFVADGYLENGEPHRYLELKRVNDCLRERGRKALICYLLSKEVKMPTEHYPDGSAKPTQFVKSEKDLSNLLLQDVEVGLCQKASRIEEAITAVQLYANRSRLGLEANFPASAEFSTVWERHFGSYQQWEKCRRRELYPENWVEFEQLELARKSDSFRLLEDRLRRQQLSVPVSGGMEILNTLQPAASKSLTVIQKSEPLYMKTINPELQGFDLMGVPEASARPSMLASLPSGKVPYWMEAAVQLKLPFIRVAAAGVPSGGITYDCEHGGCCSCCCDADPVLMDEYYFGLMPSTYYEAAMQDPGWEWTGGLGSFPQITNLAWNSKANAYLIWTRVRNGEFEPSRWSSESVAVTTGTELTFYGRILDSLYFAVPGVTLKFRYDLASDSALLSSMPTGSAVIGGLYAYPYFAYFEPGAPVVPVTNYAPAIAISQQLAAHCRYEEALKTLELEIHPLHEDNAWCKPQGAQSPSCCTGLETIPKNEILRRSLLIRYVEMLLAWGNALLKQNTPESFQQARLMFDTASQILGKCPSGTPSFAEPDNPMSVREFAPKGIPLNSRLLCLYDKVEDGLAQIHECQNARRLKNGMPNRDMSYWGNMDTDYCDISDDCGCDDSWCLPGSPYRFSYLLNKALEYAGMVSSFGGALLSAMEKTDAETLSAIRERQSKMILDATLEIKQDQYRAADWDEKALEMTYLTTYVRLQYYLAMTPYGLKNDEQKYLDRIAESIIELWIVNGLEIIAQLATLLPDTYAGVIAFLHTQPSGTKSSGWAHSGGRVAGTLSSIASTKAGRHITKAGWERQNEDRIHQINSMITCELPQIARQILASQRRRKASLRELNNHVLQMQQATETLDYLRDKFTNQQLYLWQQKELAALHFQMYECALQTAKQAQAAFVRERGFKRNFLDCGIWDNLHQGLVAGEKLQFNLRKMEKAYLDDNVREFELNKSISILHHFPEALLQLKATGYCEVELPEALFDLNYPGHYMRRIKSISLTIPCVVGPYTSVACRLTLLSSSIRTNPTLKCAAGCGCSGCQKGHDHYEAFPDDCRLMNEYVATEAIATSNAQKDSGLFQLDFRDERYLPFEYAGTISRWRIELDKECNFFDLHTVSDLILDISYTAREGGQQLRSFATDHAKGYLPGDGQKLFDVKNEMPDAWYALTQPAPMGGTLPLQFGRGLFPYIPYKHDMKVSCLEIFVEMDDCEACDQLVLDIHRTDECNGCNPQVTLVKDQAWGGMYHGVFKTDWELPKTNKDFGKLIFPTGFEGISRVYLLCCYDVVRTECVKEVTCQCC